MSDHKLRSVSWWTTLVVNARRALIRSLSFCRQKAMSTSIALKVRESLTSG
jgi:hypothetical protein